MVSFEGLSGLINDDLINGFKAAHQNTLLDSNKPLSAAEYSKRRREGIERDAEDKFFTEELSPEAKEKKSSGKIDLNSIIPDDYKNLDSEKFNQSKQRLESAIDSRERISSEFQNSDLLTDEQKKLLKDAKEKGDNALNKRLKDELKLTDDELELKEKDPKAFKAMLERKGVSTLDKYREILEESNLDLKKSLEQVRNGQVQTGVDNAVDNFTLSKEYDSREKILKLSSVDQDKISQYEIDNSHSGNLKAPPINSKTISNEKVEEKSKKSETSIELI